MKKLHYFLLALVSITIFSCQDDSIQKEDLNDNQKELIIDEALQATIVEDLLADIDIYSALGEELKSAEITGGCPMITIEKPGSAPFWPRKITLDFGDGCDKRGKMKSGKMIIEKSGPWHEVGSIRRISFENYKVEGTSIGGVKEIENITEKDGNPTFLIEAELEMAWVKNDTLNITVTRKISKTQEWITGFRNKDEGRKVVINGDVEVVKTVNGEVKTIEKSLNEITIAAGCRFPQSGITEFEVVTFDDLELEFSLDYGTEGEASEKCKENCDCIATLSWDDNSENIDLSAKWWKKARETKGDN
ncbi:MAG: hypothetical protein ABFS16_01310 [Bacteroidota bacterium]